MFGNYILRYYHELIILSLFALISLIVNHNISMAETDVSSNVENNDEINDGNHSSKPYAFVPQTVNPIQDT